MKRINTFLHSQAAVLLLLALALLAQTPHTAAVFQRLAHTDNILAWTHAAAYAMALEFATLLFVVRGKRSLAWLFAVVSVTANIAYYWQDAMSTVDMARALLISLALPACIAFYSHDVAGVAQDTSAAVPNTTPSRAKRASRAKPKKSAITEQDTEELLADVNLDGAPTMAQYWHSVKSGKVAEADKLTAKHFGTSQRTVQRQRLNNWQVA